VHFTLHEHPGGVETHPGNRIVYDLGRNVAWHGAARVTGPALVWQLEGERRGAALSADVELDPRHDWIARCDRVDFPPGGIAYRHVHPGPGIRRVLHGELTVDRGGLARTYRAGEAWLEGAEEPVLATASPAEPTAFVRVLLLPAEWAGRRTIRYVDPADEERPKLQRATVLLEEPLRPAELDRS
jgi:quercetin dioxygenase-like cupin family protein